MREYLTEVLTFPHFIQKREKKNVWLKLGFKMSTSTALIYSLYDTQTKLKRTNLPIRPHLDGC